MINEITNFFKNNIQKEIKCNTNTSNVDSIFIHSFQHVTPVSPVILLMVGQHSTIYNIIGTFGIRYKDQTGTAPTTCVSITIDRFLALKNLNKC